MFLNYKLTIFAAILALVFSLQLYSGSYNANYIGDDSENPTMSGSNYNLTVYDFCNQLFGFCIHRNDETLSIQAEYCITQVNSSNMIAVGLCPYYPSILKWCKGTTSTQNHYSFPARLSFTELTSFTCGEYNREGWLCSTWVIPCQINTQNGHPSQILPKLGEHIPYPK